MELAALILPRHFRHVFFAFSGEPGRIFVLGKQMLIPVVSPRNWKGGVFLLSWGIYFLCSSQECRSWARPVGGQRGSVECVMINRQKHTQDGFASKTPEDVGAK